jgi:antagonist of KipI
MSLLVRDPGLLTTVQDAGRFGLGALGVPMSGAMDRRSLAIANLLLGNDAGDAALEMTLVGPTLELSGVTTIGLGGADLGGTAGGGAGRTRLVPGRSYRLEAGTVVSFPGRPAASRADGSRAYLAIPGGIDVPIVLGSRSTCLAAGFGGLDGRSVRAGDRIAPVDRRAVPPLVWPIDDLPAAGSATSTTAASRPIRVVAASEVGETPPSALDDFMRSEWVVDPKSDRMGIRLEGEPLRTAENGELLSHGVPLGAIQLPRSGLPIVLAADHQSSGGYPVIAVVAAVDQGRVGQLGPGDRVRFELLDLATARQALIDAEAEFARLSAQLEEARRVAEGIDWAGA